MSLDGIRLRPITEGDLPFLGRLYASTRQEELSVVPWTEEEKADFLAMQFNAQHKHYMEHFADAAFDIVMQGEEAIGRLYIDRRDDEIRLIDIALLPEHRRLGIGGALMRRILDEGRQAALPVRIHVERNNPALHLYHRLGFERIEDQGPYFLMEWSPGKHSDRSATGAGTRT